MLGETAKHLGIESKLEKVFFVLFDDDACEIFQRVWKKIAAESGKSG